MELHEHIVPGCQAALRSFLHEGCKATGQRFSKVMRTGEYDLYCQVRPFPSFSIHITDVCAVHVDGPAIVPDAWQSSLNLLQY